MKPGRRLTADDLRDLARLSRLLDAFLKDQPMNPSEKYDVVVLGSGAGGKLLAWELAGRGKKTAVIERRYIGGSCLNIACLPSKNIIHSARAADVFRHGVAFGMIDRGWRVDMAAVRDRKRRMVDDLIAVHLENFRKSGAELVMGQGRFVAPRTLEVTLNEGGSRTLQGDAVIIDVGSRARLIHTPGLLDAKPLTHVEALDLDRVPEHLIILGGGYVGLELAQAFRRFGSRTTVVERNELLIHREDPDVAEEIARLLRDEGVEVLTGTALQRVEGTSGESVRLTTDRGSIEGSHLLVASGRVPNTDGIGLEDAGIETNERGIKVDERLRTTAEGVWAVGDCAGSPQFTHISEDDFHVVLSNLDGGDRVTTGRQVPYCLFTDPELARIGLSEREARERGVEYRLAKIPTSAVLRARTLSETRGFFKALIEKSGDRILGFTAIGPEAGEVIAAVQIAMLADLPYTSLRDAVLAHPTMAEGLKVLFSSVPPR